MPCGSDQFFPTVQDRCARRSPASIETTPISEKVGCKATPRKHLDHDPVQAFRRPPFPKTDSLFGNLGPLLVESSHMHLSSCQDLRIQRGKVNTIFSLICYRLGMLLSVKRYNDSEEHHVVHLLLRCCLLEVPLHINLIVHKKMDASVALEFRTELTLSEGCIIQREPQEATSEANKTMSDFQPLGSSCPQFKLTSNLLPTLCLNDFWLQRLARASLPNEMGERS